MSENLKSIREAATILGVGRQAVWQHYKNGKLPNAFMIGTSIAIPQEDLDRLAEYLQFRKKKQKESA